MSSEPNRQQPPYTQPAGWPATQVPTQTPFQTVEQQPGQPVATAQAAQAGQLAGPPLVPRPAVDLIENNDEIWVFIDLPGFKPEEIQLEGDARTIHVKATRPSDVEDGRRVLMHERTVQVERTIQLPTDVDLEQVDALFEDGVCKIKIPKAASERFRNIDIRT
ncbi:Hsp20/alpha crystallin family protein [Halobellus sp. Atlit-31R]|nr:Hsp20/alpha crystallin family protein [Halobellus sp. Atlit-31R]